MPSVADQTVANAVHAGKEIVQQFSFIQGLLDTGVTYVQTYAWQILAAIILLFLGFFLSNWVKGVVTRTGKKAKVDPILLDFLSNFARAVVLGFTGMIILSKLGITIAPLIAAISAGIFGATFAIQAPISNYAAGISIIFSRPFGLGDMITINGVMGKVERITLAMTFLRSDEGELIQIPNKRIIGEIIENSGEFRQVNGEVGVSYNSNPLRAIEILESILQTTEGVTDTIPAKVGIASFGDSSITILYRYHVEAKNMLTTQFAVNGKLFDQFGKEGIEIPFPQRVVTVVGSELRSK